MILRLALRDTPLAPLGVATNFWLDAIRAALAPSRLTCPDHYEEGWAVTIHNASAAQARKAATGDGLPKGFVSHFDVVLTDDDGRPIAEARDRGPDKERAKAEQAFVCERAEALPSWRCASCRREWRAAGAEPCPGCCGAAVLLPAERTGCGLVFQSKEDSPSCPNHGDRRFDHRPRRLEAPAAGPATQENKAEGPSWRFDEAGRRVSVPKGWMIEGTGDLLQRQEPRPGTIGFRPRG